MNRTEKIIADFLRPYFSTLPQVTEAVSRHQAREEITQEAAHKLIEVLNDAGVFVGVLERAHGPETNVTLNPPRVGEWITFHVCGSSDEVFAGCPDCKREELFRKVED